MSVYCVDIAEHGKWVFGFLLTPDHVKAVRTTNQAASSGKCVSME